MGLISNEYEVEMATRTIQMWWLSQFDNGEAAQ
jgi:hypothetical protein